MAVCACEGTISVVVIGLGRIGLAMARRLAERGHAVRGWDTALGRRDEAHATGIALTEHAAPGAEPVLLSLPDDAAVRAVAERLPAAGMRGRGGGGHLDRRAGDTARSPRSSPPWASARLTPLFPAGRPVPHREGC